jgi:hypothetical protein
MRRHVSMLVLLLSGCHGDPAASRDRELSKLFAERTVLMQTIEKDKKTLRRAEIQHTWARRKRDPLLVHRARVPMYQLRDRIEAGKERLEEVGRLIGALEGKKIPNNR